MYLSWWFYEVYRNNKMAVCWWILGGWSCSENSLAVEWWILDESLCRSTVIGSVKSVCLLNAFFGQTCLKADNYLLSNSYYILVNSFVKNNTIYSIWEISSIFISNIEEIKNKLTIWSIENVMEIKSFVKVNN